MHKNVFCDTTELLPGKAHYFRPRDAIVFLYLTETRKSRKTFGNCKNKRLFILKYSHIPYTVNITILVWSPTGWPGWTSTRAVADLKAWMERISCRERQRRRLTRSEVLQTKTQEWTWSIPPQKQTIALRHSIFSNFHTSHSHTFAGTFILLAKEL